MALQGQTLTFTIPSGGSYNGGSLVAKFQGNSITNNQAWGTIQSINVTYDDAKKDHHRAINQFMPTIEGIAGTSVTVGLQFEYSDNKSNYMSGFVQVLILADVN